ncbi:MAG: relaxase [Hymenobacter sp.]|nr:MAG: relaxase [Hymenobacter sp.]
MIIKGGSRTNGQQLGRYLTAKGENEQVQVFDVRGATTQDAAKAVLEFSLASELTKRGKNGLYSASISPAVGEDATMTQDDWLKSADVLEKKLGLTGQPRAIVFHEKIGTDGKKRQHLHCVWQREKDGKFLKMSHNYRQHDSARKALEQEFGHKFTRQPVEAKQTITEAWHQSKTGREFLDRAKVMGYAIAQGTRRGYTIVDEKLGQKADFVRQLIGIKTHEAAAKLQDVQGQLKHEDEYQGAHVRSLTDRQNAQQERTGGRKRAAKSEGQKIQDEQPATEKRGAEVQEQAASNFEGIIPKPKTLAERIRGASTEITGDNEFKRRMDKAWQKGRDDNGLEHEIR